MISSLQRKNLVLLAIVCTFSVFATFFWSSCTFTPTGVNYVEVKPSLGDSLDLYIRLNNSADTLALWGNVLMEYSIGVGQRKIHQINFYLNDSLYFSSQRIKPFWLQTKALPDGEYALKVEVIAEAGTGSLADRLGAEVLVLTRVWRLLIDNSPPTPVQIKAIRPYKGRLLVEWQTYSRPNFQRYVLWRGRVSGDRLTDITMIDTIYSQFNPSWIDSSYIGGLVGYQIDVIAGNQRARSQPTEFNSPFSKFIGFEQTADRKIRLTWQRSNFPANFQSYTLSHGNYLEPIAVITDVDDTTYVDEGAKFGGLIEYRLHTNQFSLRAIDDTTAWLGQRTMAYWRARYVEPLSSIYIYRGQKVVRLDANTFAVLHSLTLPSLSPIYLNYASFDISRDGQYAYASSHTTLYKLDPQNLEILETYDTSDFLNYEYSAIPEIFVTDSNQIIYLGELVTPHGRKRDGIVFLDMNQKKLIARFPYPQSFSYPSALRDVNISANGEFLAIQYELFRFAGGLLKKIGDIVFQHFNFIEDGSRCVTTDANGISIRNTRDLSVIKTITTSSQRRGPVIDPVTGLLGSSSYTESKFFVIDPETGLDIVIVPAFTFRGSKRFYQLFNNRLYSRAGYYLKLQ